MKKNIQPKIYNWWLSGGVSLSNQIADAHIARVLADGGVIDDQALTRSVISSLCSIYSITSESEFKNKIPVSIYPHALGYKKGTGSGVTVDQACEKSYSVNENADVIQATAASKPLILTHSGDNYYWNPRVSGNSCRTTNSQITSYNSATDTLRFTAKIFLNNQTTTSFDYLSSIGSAGNFAIANKGASKQLRFRGTANAVDSTQYTPSATAPHWVRYTVSTTTVTYEWSADGTNWTTIGTPSRPTVGTLSANFTICDTALTQLNVTSVYYAKFENITAGTSCTFTPNLYNRTAEEDQWDDVDCSWSVLTDSAVTGLKGVMVDETTIQGNGTSYKLANASLAISQPYTSYSSVSRKGTGVIYGLGASSQLSNDATNTILNNGTALNKSNTSKAKQLVTCISDGANSSIQVDNDVPTTGNAGANNGTYLEVLANGATYGNYSLTYLLIVNG